MFVFDPNTFRLMFPEFANPVIYTDAYLQAKWSIAKCFISIRGCWAGCATQDCQANIAYYLVAHLVALDDAAKPPVDGTAPAPIGKVSSASIDKVSVTIMSPPATDSWDWWLHQTRYGDMLVALLPAMCATVAYVGGSPERMAIRKAFGRF